MSTRSLGEPRTAALPRSFLLWLGAATLSTWGDSVMYFALGWAATGIGPQWGGVVLTTVLLPRTVLLLDAFSLPATGSFPRLFVDDADLPRALALTSSAGRLVRLGAGPAGGLLVALAGLSGAAVVDAASFAVVLGVLVVIRPRHEAPPSATAGPLWHQVAYGWSGGHRPCAPRWAPSPWWRPSCCRWPRCASRSSPARTPGRR